jgi:hypothetical protein
VDGFGAGREELTSTSDMVGIWSKTMVSKDDLVWSMIDLTIKKNKIEGLRRMRA